MWWPGLGIENWKLYSSGHVCQQVRTIDLSFERVESHQTLSLQWPITFGTLCEYIDLKSSLQPQSTNPTPRWHCIICWLYPFCMLLRMIVNWPNPSRRAQSTRLCWLMSCTRSLPSWVCHLAGTFHEPGLRFQWDLKELTQWPGMTRDRCCYQHVTPYIHSLFLFRLRWKIKSNHVQPYSPIDHASVVWGLRDARTRRCSPARLCKSFWVQQPLRPLMVSWMKVL